MTFYEAHRSTQAWFEYAEPGLLTNRTIRNFLSSYKTDSWPDIVKLTLLYGIVTLRKHVGGLEQIPLEKIRTLVRQMEAAHCIEEKLPPIHEKMKDLKGDVQEILEAFDTPTNTAARAKNNCVNPTDPTQKNAEAPKESQPAGIYPDWWGDGSHEEKFEHVNVSAPNKSKEEFGFLIHWGLCRMLKPDRPPPRLCYSVPPREQTQVDSDDIVEPKYYFHHFDRARDPKASAQKSTQALPSMANITDSFLNNRWTSTLCQSPSVETRDARSAQLSYPLHHTTSTQASCEASVALSDFHANDEMFRIPRPRSASFWVDLTPEPNQAATSTQPKPREHGGCVIDFGHLDSPRFPKSIKETITTESLTDDSSICLDFASQTPESLSHKSETTEDTLPLEFCFDSDSSDAS